MNRTTTSPQTVDDYVEAFEAAHAEFGYRADLLNFLPAPNDELYCEVAAELIRVDMEYSWSHGEKKRLESYRTILPDVLREREILAQVAYEEYRLRAQAGEPVSADQYHVEYGIETDSWPRWSTSQQVGSQAPLESSLPELWEEALELAKDVQDFPETGDAFLGFSLESELGKGAFSHVFLAMQAELANRQVVLKIASGNSLEPQHLARLQHTNIVPIYSVHRQNNLTAVCMPYFGHRTLADLLAVVREAPGKLSSPQNLISTFLHQQDPTARLPISGAKLPSNTENESRPKVLEEISNSTYIDAAVLIIKQIAEGLAHAHERGIVHRDLKPANVLLTDEGLPMLLDFNLSQEVVVNGRSSLLVGGTLPYMSPEQLQGVSSGTPISFETDIYSLGVMFCELLTGQRPFANHSGAFDDVVRAMIADRRAGFSGLRDQNPSVPKSIEGVVSRCLMANPDQRYGTAAELVEDLGCHLRNEPLTHALDRSVRERVRKWLRRHPRISSAGGVATLAICAAAIMLGFWFARGQRLARLEAQEFLDAYRQDKPTLELALGLQQTDRQVLQDGISATRAHLEEYQLLDNPTWRDLSRYRALNSEDKASLHQSFAEELFLISTANERLLKTSDIEEKRKNLAEEGLRFNRLAVSLFSPEAPPKSLVAQQARLLSKLGEEDAANKIVATESIQQSDENPIDQYAQIYDLIARRDYYQAESFLTSLRDRAPQDPLPWLLLGNTKIARQKLWEAEGCFSTAIALEPEYYLAYLQRGFERLHRKQYEAAQEDFERVIGLKPKLACGYLNRALTYRALRKYPEAIADLTKAIDLGTSQTRVYFLRSDLRRLLRDAEGAEADRKIGLKLIPTDEQSWMSRGHAQLKTNPEAALADFRQALHLNPNSKTALLKCAHVLADRLDKLEESLEAIDQILRSNPNDVDALASRAVLYARAGQREDVLTDIRRILPLTEDPKIFFQAACALSLTSTSEESDVNMAVGLLAKSVQADPRWFVLAHTDPDLKPIRGTEAFQEFATNTRKMNRVRIELEKAARPSSPELPRSEAQSKQDS